MRLKPDPAQPDLYYGPAVEYINVDKIESDLVMIKSKRDELTPLAPQASTSSRPPLLRRQSAKFMLATGMISEMSTLMSASRAKRTAKGERTQAAAMEELMDADKLVLGQMVPAFHFHDIALDHRIQLPWRWIPAPQQSVTYRYEHFEVRALNTPAVTLRLSPSLGRYKFAYKPGLRVRTLTSPLRAGALAGIDESGLCELRVDNSSERFMVDPRPDVVGLDTVVSLDPDDALILLLELKVLDASVIVAMPEPNCYRLHLTATDTLTEVHLNMFNHCRIDHEGLDRTSPSAAAYVQSASQLCATMAADYGTYIDAATGRPMDINMALSMRLETAGDREGELQAGSSSQVAPIRSLEELSAAVLDDSDLLYGRLPSFIISGRPGQGKSVMLRKLAHAIAQKYSQRGGAADDAGAATPTLPLLSSQHPMCVTMHMCTGCRIYIYMCMCACLRRCRHSDAASPRPSIPAAGRPPGGRLVRDRRVDGVGPLPPHRRSRAEGVGVQAEAWA